MFSFCAVITSMTMTFKWF